MSVKKRGLGRGLDALLGAAGNRPPEAAGAAGTTAFAGSEDSLLRKLPVDLIQRGKYQPRRDIDPESLQELADSIKVQAVPPPGAIPAKIEGKIQCLSIGIAGCRDEAEVDIDDPDFWTK